MYQGSCLRAVAGVVLLSAFVLLPVQAQETEQDQQQDQDQAQEQEQVRVQDIGTLQADLSGYNEVPSLWSPASGSFSASPSDDGTGIDYELDYTGLSTPIQAAHLHLGTPGANGGIIVFLCSNQGAPPADVPACPEQQGNVTGTLTAASVVGPAEQGIAEGEFEKLVDALMNGAVYANVHTDQYPQGEIRGQLRAPGDQQQTTDQQATDQQATDQQAGNGGQTAEQQQTGDEGGAESELERALRQLNQ